MQDLKVMVRCSACGALNRVSLEKVDGSLRCGECHGILRVPHAPVAVTEMEFEKEVLSWPGAVLVEFWSHGCVFCAQLVPVLESLAAEMAGKLKVVTMNTAYSPALAGRLGVQGVPTMYLYRNGAPVARTAGALPRERLKEWITTNSGW